MNVPLEEMLNTAINYSIIWNNLSTGDSATATAILSELETRILDIISHIPKGQVA